MRVISSNLHSCHGIIQDFRKNIPSTLTVSFADVVFPDERLSYMVGREVKFLLAVDEKGAAGCCILALSTEPLRTEMIFIHSMRKEETVLQSLLDSVLSLLQFKRTRDLVAKHVEDMHSSLLREALKGRGFAVAVKDRMLLEVTHQNQLDMFSDHSLKVRTTNSLLNWRALYLSATTSQPFDECRKQVHHETPYGTIQEDDLERLLAYQGNSPVGTLGYSLCRNIGILDRLSVMSNIRDRSDIVRALLVEASRLIIKKRCDHIVMDVERDSMPKGILGDLGFKSLGEVSYFYKVITSKPTARTVYDKNERD